VWSWWYRCVVCQLGVACQGSTQPSSEAPSLLICVQDQLIHDSIPMALSCHVLCLQMDNGEIEVFNAYRVQHNNSRGPYKVGREQVYCLDPCRAKLLHLVSLLRHKHNPA
jgi:hypothetical protein